MKLIKTLIITLVIIIAIAGCDKHGTYVDQGRITKAYFQNVGVQGFWVLQIDNGNSYAIRAYDYSVKMNELVTVFRELNGQHYYIEKGE